MADERAQDGLTDTGASLHARLAGGGLPRRPLQVTQMHQGLSIPATEVRVAELARRVVGLHRGTQSGQGPSDVAPHYCDRQVESRADLLVGEVVIEGQPYDAPGGLDWAVELIRDQIREATRSMSPAPDRTTSRRYTQLMRPKASGVGPRSGPRSIVARWASANPAGCPSAGRRSRPPPGIDENLEGGTIKETNRSQCGRLDRPKHGPVASPRAYCPMRTTSDR